MEEQKPIVEVNKEEKRSNTSMVIWISVILFLSIIVILFVIRANNPNFNIQKILIWGGSIALFFLVVLGGFWYLNKNKHTIEEEAKKKVLALPQPITLAECRNFVKRAMYDPVYAQYLCDPLIEGPIIVGKNQKNSIYVFVAEGMYKNSGITNNYAILINMHYPEIYRKILVKPTPFTSYELVKIANLLSTSPEDEPDTRETEEQNPLLGYYKKVKETQHKKEEKKEIKEKEDLE
jgi:hypothetical protein